MSLVIPKTCAMGGSKTGLVGTIGITLVNPDGTVHTPRTTVGIYELFGGCYGKIITFPDSWSGSILWDTGGGSPVYATEDYEIEGMLQNVEADTNELQLNQGAWLTAIGFAIPNEYDVRLAAIQTDLDDPAQYKATGFAVPNEYDIEFTALQADSAYMLKTIKNKKVLTKTGDVWQLIVYDDDSVTPILTKDILDKDGAKITDLEAGALAKEMKSVV